MDYMLEKEFIFEGCIVSCSFLSGLGYFTIKYPDKVVAVKSIRIQEDRLGDSDAYVKMLATLHGLGDIKNMKVKMVPRNISSCFFWITDMDDMLCVEYSWNCGKIISTRFFRGSLDDFFLLSYICNYLCEQERWKRKCIAESVRGVSQKKK